MPIVSTGQITISDLNDGLNAYLTQEACLISTAQDGTGGVYTIANTTMVVRQGTADVSTQWTVTASAGSGVTGTLTTRTYQVTAMTVDTGYVDLTASKSGETPITLRFTITKAKQGVTGTRGTIVTSAATAGTVWSSSEADAAIAAAGGGTPIPGDVVTLYNSGASFSQTRVRNSLGNWALLAAFFGGDVLVDGTLGAQKIAANSITANQMAAGSITAVAIAAGAISASKLVIADFSNLVASPDFSDMAAWSGSTAYGNTIVAPSSTWLRPTLYRLTDSTAQRVLRSTQFAVNEGEQFFISGQVQVIGGAGTIGLQLIGNTVPGYSGENVVGTFFSTTSTSVTSLSGMVTIPAGIRYIYFRFVKGTGVSDAYFGAPMMRRAASGELIVDGSVVASKISASAITADKIQAGAILASKLAIGDTSNVFVDPQLLDKAVWTFAGGLLDADVTLAAAVTGSGSSTKMFTVAIGASGSAISSPIPCESSKNYWVSTMAWCPGSGGTAASPTVNVLFYSDVAGTVATSIGSTALVGVSAATSATAMTAQVTAPTDAVSMRLQFVQPVASTTRVARFSTPIIRRANSGELIVDGAITAAHVGTNTIITDTANIATGIITNAQIVSVTADKITVPPSGGLNPALTVGTTGVNIGNMAGVMADSPYETRIDPGSIQISGGTTLSDWRMGGDLTRINGGSISANTVAANAMQIGMRNIKVDSIAFEANTPATNSVSWTNGQINYVNDAGTATAVSISAGNAAWTTGRLYIYWVKGATTLSSTTTGATAMGANNVVLAVYVGGLNLTTDIGRTIIDGSGIKTGSVTADRINATSFGTSGLAVFGGALQSSNFATGSAGWKINNTGAAEFNELVVREDMIAAGAVARKAYITQWSTITVTATTIGTAQAMGATSHPFEVSPYAPSVLSPNNPTLVTLTYDAYDSGGSGRTLYYTLRRRTIAGPGAWTDLVWSSVPKMRGAVVRAVDNASGWMTAGSFIASPLYEYGIGMFISTTGTGSVAVESLICTFEQMNRVA
jgi:hypothetical protein